MYLFIFPVIDGYAIDRVSIVFDAQILWNVLDVIEFCLKDVGRTPPQFSFV